MHIADMNCGIHDKDVLELARKHDAILVTLDSDFSHILFNHQVIHTQAVIFLRDKKQRKRLLFNMLVKTLHAIQFSDNMFITIDTEKVRVNYW